MNIVVLDRKTLGPGIDLSPLEQVGTVQAYDLTSSEELPERIREADVIVCNKMKLGSENLARAQRLKLICVTATGFDCIDTAWCRQRGIGVCNVPGYSTHSVAQLTLTMALALNSHLADYRNFVDSGAYSRGGVANRLTPVWHELNGMTWGILGGGNIGRRVAELAECFGCRVIVHRRKADDRFCQVDLDTLCRESDILSIHVPLTEQTRGMISGEKIAMMKEGAVLINVARGAVCDELALTEAVESGHLGGLGVDVFSVEPFPEDHPYNRILGRENVCLTPHMAWGSLEARNRCIQVVGENIRDFLRGGNQNRVEEAV